MQGRGREVHLLNTGWVASVLHTSQFSKQPCGREVQTHTRTRERTHTQFTEEKSGMQKGKLTLLKSHSKLVGQ